MKPDYHREKDGLGISHSVTHCCSLDTAHVHKIRRAREKGRTKRSEGGGWDKEQEVVRKRRRGEKVQWTERIQKMKIKWKGLYRRTKETQKQNRN